MENGVVERRFYFDLRLNRTPQQRDLSREFANSAIAVQDGFLNQQKIVGVQTCML